MTHPSTHTLAIVLSLALLLGACTSSAGTEAAAGEGPPVLQGGAPGQAPVALTAAEVDAIEPPPHTDRDVAFMQGMIHHHAQALEMTALVADRTSLADLTAFAERMDTSQHDEIDLMVRWLEARGAAVPDTGPDSPHARGEHEGGLMPGMLTTDQMARLAAAEGTEFDLLFIDAMTFHHEGALLMVDQLYGLEDGSGQEPELSTFATHVLGDQSVELARMVELRAAVEAA